MGHCVSYPENLSGCLPNTLFICPSPRISEKRTQFFLILLVVCKFTVDQNEGHREAGSGVQ